MHPANARCLRLAEFVNRILADRHHKNPKHRAKLRRLRADARWRGSQPAIGPDGSLPCDRAPGGANGPRGHEENQSHSQIHSVVCPHRPQPDYSGRLQTAKYQTPVAIILSFVGAPASASCIRCNLQPIPTQLHAAPSSRPLLADVLKMQHALGTLADALRIHSRE